jgi:hypothetical protein
MKEIKLLKTSSDENAMWWNTIEKINELVVAVNEMIPFTMGLTVEKESKCTCQYNEAKKYISGVVHNKNCPLS